MFGSLIGGALSLGGSIISGLSSRSNAKAQMAFQERMSSTAHQREVQDLIAAGLNPMLSARLGGASSPGGAMAQTPDYGQAINSGLQASVVHSNIEKTKADTKVAESQERLNDVMAYKVQADTRLGLSNAQHSEFEYERKKYLEDKFDYWFSEGKEFDARRAVAMRDQFMASRDYNTVQFLDQFAISKGFRNFDEAVKTQEFRAALQRYTLQQFEFPKAEALAEFYKSDYGKEIAPYLSSAGGASDLIGTVGAGVGIGKKLLGK